MNPLRPALAALALACAFLPFASPSLSAVAPGDVLFCDVTGGYGLASYSPTQATTISVAAGNLIPRPTGVAVESANTALVTSIQPGRVVRVDLTTGAQTMVAQDGPLGSNPDGITMAPNGHAYVTTLVSSAIVEVNLTTGGQRLVTSGNFLSAPIFITPFGPNTLVAASSSNGRIVEVDIATGAQRIVSSGGGLFTPEGIVVLPNGNLLVADYYTGTLLIVDPVTGAQSVLTSGIDSAWGLSLDGIGSVYVTRYIQSANGLVRVNLATGEKTTLTTPNVTAFGVQVFQPSTEPPPPPPPAPAEFTASDDDPTGVILEWTPVPEAAAYRLFRDGTPIASLPSVQTSYRDEPAVGTYAYCILAYNWGGQSAQVCDSGTRRAYLNEPAIQFVRDVAGDQGGAVAIGWLASELDVSVNRVITGYRVWRRLITPPAPAALATASADGGGVRMRAVNGEVEYWEPILTLPAAFREGYGAVVPTTQDSLPDSNPYTAFFVSALTADPFVFHDSPVDSGYSVDNLAPPPPPQLTGAYQSTGAVRLSWRRPAAPDLRDFRVFRGPAREIDPAEDVLLGETPDTTFTDAGGGIHYYKVVAVDVHGNQGAPAVLSPLDIPTPAWVLDAGGEWRDGALTVEVRLVGDYGWSRATVLRGQTPDLEGAVVVASELAPAEPGLFRYVEADVPAGGALWYWMRIADGEGRLALAGPVVVEPASVLEQTAVFRPIPNPVHGTTAIAFVVGSELGATSVPVRARVVDAAGRRVRDLDLGAIAPGRHQLTWDRRDARGSTVAAGIYRVLIRIGSRSFGRSVVVL